VTEEETAELDRIRAAMVKQEYFVMHRRSIAPHLKPAAMLAHFRWIVEMEKSGHILLTGGIFNKDGTQSEGLTIFRAESWEAAEALAASDPVIIAGADSYYIERFRLGGGRFTVSVDFSDQSYRLL
jgi:uncharacterized protein YciI